MVPIGEKTGPATGISARWIPIAAILLACLYLPTLGDRFDFIDDGNLVYPDGPMPTGQRLAVLWNRIEANYEDLGPFRPTLWVHWKVFAELNDGIEVRWRLTRLLWCAMSAGMLLWLMRELKLQPTAAVIAAAIAVWNPFRSEIWTSNTLAEGVAMPYALFALVAARKAAPSRRPWLWDLAGFAAILVALGCKNTFAALLPAQIFLRLAVDGLSIREGWRRYRLRVLALSAALIMPLAHLVYFKLHWHPGQYTTSPPSFGRLIMILHGYRGGIGLEFLAAGFVAMALVSIAARSTSGFPARRVAGSRGHAISNVATGLWTDYRAALGCGTLLLLAGIVIYLPMDAMSGRYVMPGIWGLDILIGLLITCFVRNVPESLGKAAAWTALAVGLAAIAVSTLGKQEKHTARTQMLWTALEWVEAHGQPGMRVAWYGGTSATSPLNVEEGIHFAWHLERRHRANVEVDVFDETGHPWRGMATPGGDPDFRIVGPSLAGDPSWSDECKFTGYYRAGFRKFECIVQRVESERPGKSHAENSR